MARRQNSILRQAQDGDPDNPFTKALRGTYNDLETEKTTTLAVIAQLGTADQAEPTRPGSADMPLLDALPYLPLNYPPSPTPLNTSPKKHPPQTKHLLTRQVLLV